MELCSMLGQHVENHGERQLEDWDSIRVHETFEVVALPLDTARWCGVAWCDLR